MPNPRALEITLIAAVARNGVIGANNQLLWHLPADMAYFRRQTQGAVVIMGRNTWESLPPRFRPLPGRMNIVLSRDAAYSAPGAQLAADWEQAQRMAASSAEVAAGASVFVIGGEQVYRQALPHARRLLLTEIAQDFQGDAFFPTWAAGEFVETLREAHPALEPGGLSYAFVTYQRQSHRS